VATAIAGVILGGAHIWKDDWSQCLEPRLLLPVLNVPLLHHLLRWLRTLDIEDVVLCANAGVRWLRAYARDGSAWKLRLHYYVDRLPRGPAGCLSDAGRLVEADEYLVVEGATIPTLDARRLLAQHHTQRAAATLAVHVATDDTPGAAGGSTPVGTYVFERAALSAVPPHSYQDIKETLVPQLLRAGQVLRVFPAPPPAPRITDLAGYLAIQDWALRHLVSEGDDVTASSKMARCWLDPGARVADSARLVGPVLVGAGSRIEALALLIGPVVVGRGCRIGSGAVVSNSVIWDAATVEPEARIDSCVVATGAVVKSKTCLHHAVHRTCAVAE